MKSFFKISSLFKQCFVRVHSGKRRQFPVSKRSGANAMPALTGSQLYALLDAEDTRKSSQSLGL
jgi:hypothetical protein